MGTKAALRDKPAAPVAQAKGTPSTGAKSTGAKPTRYDLANRVFFRLYQSSNLMHRTGTRAVSGHGATTQQWAVMGALSRPINQEHGMSVKELMAFLAVSRQSLSIVLKRLEGLGLVKRVRFAEDGRIRNVTLTSKGRRTWTRMHADIDAYYTMAMQDFSDADARALYVLLDRLTLRLTRL